MGFFFFFSLSFFQVRVQHRLLAHQLQPSVRLRRPLLRQPLPGEGGVVSEAGAHRGQVPGPLPRSATRSAHTHTHTRRQSARCLLTGSWRWPTNQGAAEMNAARPVDLQPRFIIIIANIFTQSYFGATKIILVKGRGKKACSSFTAAYIDHFWLDDDNPSF